MIFSKRPTVVPKIVLVPILGIAAAVYLAIFATNDNPLPLKSRLVPAAYQLPKIPGGTSLRLAMVHDILHERYLRHGPAWYQQRNRDAETIIAEEQAKPGPPSLRYLDALDDRAIGDERTGHLDEAVAVMHRKLALVSPLPGPTPVTQPAIQGWVEFDADKDDLNRIIAAENLSPLQRHQYSACADLGTILIHRSMHRAMAGDAAAIGEVREGLGYIEKAIAINPGAHFGRERWQAIAVEYLLACVDHPQLLQQYDLIGQPMVDWPGRSKAPWRSRYWDSLGDSLDVTPAQREDVREDLPRVGGEKDWADAIHADYTDPMPFDEPTLAIIGMWTLGGGPNPHFALTLGGIMESIGQKQIAWNAYERAVEMKEQFWPDPAVCETLAQFCRDRQSAIAAAESKDPDAWQTHMRQTHQSELAWGRAYQKDYQDYEAQKIAAGTPLDDPHFYDDFFRNRPSIASDPGLADYILVSNVSSMPYNVLPLSVLGAGIVMTLATIFPRRKKK